jgi:hypothetical protein
MRERRSGPNGNFAISLRPTMYIASFAEGDHFVIRQWWESEDGRGGKWCPIEHRTGDEAYGPPSGLYPIPTSQAYQTDEDRAELERRARKT